MKRFIPYLLLVTGICLSLSAVMIVVTQDVMAQGSTQDGAEPGSMPQYAGTSECRDCHRSTARAHADTIHAWTMVEIREDPAPENNPVIADFSQGDDVRSVTFPGESTARAFTLDDIAFTLGAGRNVQAYLYQAEDDTFYVFPAEWRVAEQTWEPLALAETWPDEAFAFGPNCAGCHTVGLNVETYEWEEESVMCEACHGPGLNHVEAADRAGGSIDEEEFIEITSNINLALDGQVCGQCHVRGLSTDGVHPFAAGFYPGLTELTDVYNLAAVHDEEFFWPTGHARLPNMQYNEWANSAHPHALVDIQARVAYKAECLTCHSATQQLVDLRLSYDDVDPAMVDALALGEEYPYGVTCASCHDPHKEAGEGEALPAAMLREDGYTLCVSCHRANDIVQGIHYPVREVFEGLPLINGIAVQPSPHFSAEDGPTCVTCHMTAMPTYNGERASHTFEVITPGQALSVESLQSSCSGCHTEDPAQLQQLMDDLRNGTRSRISTARRAVGSNTAQWVVAALDVVENEGSYGIHNYSYTSSLLKQVELQLGIQGASLTNTDISAQIDEALPEVEDMSVPLGQEPLVTVGGLTTPSIVLLVIAGLILAVTAIVLYRSESR